MKHSPYVQNIDEDKINELKRISALNVDSEILDYMDYILESEENAKIFERLLFTIILQIIYFKENSGKSVFVEHYFTLRHNITNYTLKNFQTGGGASFYLIKFIYLLTKYGYSFQKLMYNPILVKQAYLITKKANEENLSESEIEEIIQRKMDDYLIENVEESIKYQLSYEKQMRLFSSLNQAEIVTAMEDIDLFRKYQNNLIVSCVHIFFLSYRRRLESKHLKDLLEDHNIAVRHIKSLMNGVGTVYLLQKLIHLIQKKGYSFESLFLKSINSPRIHEPSDEL